MTTQILDHARGDGDMGHQAVPTAAANWPDQIFQKLREAEIRQPQIAGYSSETGKHRFASDCVVVDAPQIEPVSTFKFPALREF